MIISYKSHTQLNVSAEPKNSCENGTFVVLVTKIINKSEETEKNSVKKFSYQLL